MGKKLKRNRESEKNLNGVMILVEGETKRTERTIGTI